LAAINNNAIQSVSAKANAYTSNLIKLVGLVRVGCLSIYTYQSDSLIDVNEGVVCTGVVESQKLVTQNRSRAPLSRIAFHPLFGWFGVFVVLVLMFFSFAQLIVTKPAIFQRLASIDLVMIKAEGDVSTTKTEFGSKDIVKAVIEYTGASQGVEVTLVFARLVSDTKTRNGREVLSQVVVPLTNQQGKKSYFFPAFEKKPGNYEITLQSNGDIIAKSSIQLRNE
jgi:hypothetical protein